MKKATFIFAIILLAAFSALAQNVDKVEIGDRDVVWDDFFGRVDPNSRFDAFTYWSITYSFEAPVDVGGDKVSVKASTHLFLTEASWVKPNKKSARLLKHEQGHFRIGRLCAREIEAEMNGAVYSGDNYRTEIDALYWRILKKYQAMNRQYDSETANYTNTDAQKRWDETLDALLRH